MITVSKSSKLGRYYEWQMDHVSGKLGDPWKNLSLCRFVQGLFWRSLFLLVAVAILLIIGSAILSMYLAPLLSLMGFHYFDDTVTISLVMWLLTLAMAAIIYIGKKFENRPEKKPKEPSIVVEWVKAKKNKVCPRINVVD